MEPDSSPAFSKSQEKLSGQIVSCNPEALRPHPSYVRHGLSVPADKMAALRARGELAFLELIAITREQTIIDGYAHWELAKELRRSMLYCIEYGLSETEALQWILQRHRRCTSLNDYSRIMLAWDLEPMLIEKARVNKQIGGREKGWSNLTKAEQVHVRSEIAKAAAVSTGNVTKVKQLNESCVAEIKQALYADEISIHWAWKLRDHSPDDQLDAIGRFRFEKGLLKDVRKLAARQRRIPPAVPQDIHDLVNWLSQLAEEKLGAVEVGVIKGDRPKIFITEELARIIGLGQQQLWNQGVVYRNLSKPPESCGPSRESARPSATI